LARGGMRVRHLLFTITLQNRMELQ